ncbi:MAG: hypothetical protein GC146_08130 [Limimaricola sp.]|uniref:hypothetical protein n=1 Tax=Limimaricola sp. TaxID=2211665 RepID=UPI001D3BB134|nr:hypothetical protein [Limimaricola sp.]MBI1417173.1 hypothetical protein [Limimaricola sp.]
MQVNVRKIAAAVGTFAVALGIGFAMQNGDALASRFLNNPPVQAPAPQVATATPAPVVPQQAAQPSLPVMASVSMPPLPAPLPAPTQAAFVPASPATAAPVPAAEAPAAPVLMALANDTPPVPGGTQSPVVATADCSPTLNATVGEAALVSLSLAAPCDPDAQVTFHHQGMIFSLLTDADGKATVTVPALATTAVFMAAFENGDSATATVEVPELTKFDRAVLQWSGPAALTLNAYEFGAGFKDEGHVWVQAPRDSGVAVAGEGGFLVHLGAPGGPNPLMAEVYTFPAAGTGTAGNIRLAAEAEVNAQSCGTQIDAQSMQLVPGEPMQAHDLTLSLPDCDGTVSFLEIPQMFSDIAVAAK